MDDEEEVADVVEWVCERCAGFGCAHCDPEWSQVYPLAAALDCILTGTPFGGDVA